MFVNIGGEIRAIGDKGKDRPWRAGVERPDEATTVLLFPVAIEDDAIATSGDYRRYLEVGGVRLAHTMDSRRLSPVNNGVASVTVLAVTCMHADAWATALLVAGPAEGMAMAERLGLDALFIIRDAGGLVEKGLGRFSEAA